MSMLLKTNVINEPKNNWFFYKKVLAIKSDNILQLYGFFFKWYRMFVSLFASKDLDHRYTLKVLFPVKLIITYSPSRTKSHRNIIFFILLYCT